MQIIKKRKHLRSLTATLATVLTLSMVTPALANEQSFNGQPKSGWTHAANVEQIVYDGKTRHPRFMKGILSPVIQRDEEIVKQFQANSFLHFEPSDQQYQVVKSEKDDQNKEHVLYQQLFKGTPVYGKFLQVHLNADRQIYAIMNSTAEGMDQLNLNVNPSLTGEQAIAKYKAHLEQQLGYTIETGGTFHNKAVSQPIANLSVYEKEGTYSLVYVIDFNYMNPEIGNWVGFVDAFSGQVVDEFSKIENILSMSMNRIGTGASNTGDGQQQLPLNIYLRNPGSPSPIYDLVDNTKQMANGGYIITYDYNDLSGFPISSNSTTFTDKHAVDAHYLTGKVYDYYKNTFGRDSLDGLGMTLESNVHKGTNYANAYWTMVSPTDGYMVYGDGDGTNFKCMSCEMDVVAHELTHGLTAFTAKLEYKGQSGALNEAFSDIMAAVMDGNWTVGEDTGTIIRSMSDPNAYNQPKDMSQYVNTVSDNRGVHVNNGIPNHAAYLIATKLDQAGYSGKSLLGKLAYYALTKYLTSSSKFIDARNAFYTAVDDLGLSSTDNTIIRNIVNQAWQEVGVPYTDTIAADASEPNNTFALAKTIPFGTKIAGTLQTDDLDYYKFTIGGNVTQSVYTYLYGYSGKMTAVLFNETSTVPQYLTDTTVSVSTYGASALKRSLDPGNYYLLVDTYGESFNSKGPYSLFFSTDSSKSAITSHLAERINEAGQLLNAHAYISSDKKNALNQAISEAQSVTNSVYTAGTQFDETLKLDTAIKTFSAETDKAAPIWSSESALSASNITTSSLKLTWPLAQDALSGVTQYKIYQGSVLLSTVADSVYTYDVSNLSAGTPYIFKVQAGDDLGNWTTTGLSVSATTLSNSTINSGGSGGYSGGNPQPAPSLNKDGKMAYDFKPTHIDMLIELNKQVNELTLDAKTKENVDVLSIEIDADIVQRASQLNRPIVIASNDISMQIPPYAWPIKLSTGKVLFTSTKTNTSIPHFTSASPIYDFSVTDNGSKISLFGSPVQVTIPFDAKKVQNVHNLSVYVFDEDQGAWTPIGGTLNSDGTISASLAHFSKYAVLEKQADTNLQDIKNHWAQKEIEDLAGRGIIDGIDNHSFQPDGTMTRAQFVTIIAKALKLQDDGKASMFNDVPTGAWYHNSVYAAYSAGIISGLNEQTFSPDAPITREQMAVTMVNAYLHATGKKLEDIVTTQEVKYADEGTISTWARSYVRIASALGLLSGTGGGQFAPADNASRAQAAVVIYRLLNKVQ